MNYKTTLLYLDDEPINLYIFEINFKKNYNVITCKSGFEGLSKLEENPDIEIVISDMNMPGMNGLEFIKKAKEKVPAIIFYILTGYEITPEIRKALDEKLVSRYFRKPLNAEEIRSSIDQVKCFQ